jgi:hypothetical protein
MNRRITSPHVRIKEKEIKYGSILRGVLDDVFDDVISGVCVADFRPNIR